MSQRPLLGHDSGDTALHVLTDDSDDDLGGLDSYQVHYVTRDDFHEQSLRTVAAAAQGKRLSPINATSPRAARHARQTRPNTPPNKPKSKTRKKKKKKRAPKKEQKKVPSYALRAAEWSSLDAYQQHVAHERLLAKERSCVQRVAPLVPGLCVVVVLVTGLVLLLTVLQSRVDMSRWEILRYASIPVVSTVFTYAHIWLALQMTFYPLEFIGCFKPFCGWQGIVPMKAAKMAEIAVDLMMERLIDMREVFSRIRPERVAQELGPLLEDMLGDLIHEVAMEQRPEVWLALPASLRREVVAKAAEDSPAVIEAMMTEVRDNITDVFDLKHMVVEKLVRDKALLNEMFIRVGSKEFTYIKELGAKIGFIFGVGQMVLWFYYRAAWVLPATGFLAGYLTNWLALKMIFEPAMPVSCCCGACVFQGMFLKRQTAVSAEYAVLVTRNILNARNVMEGIIRGPSSDRLFEIMGRHIKAGIDSYAGMSQPVVRLIIGSDNYAKAKSHICDRALEHLPACAEHLEEYTTEALDMENLLFDKMHRLSPDAFVSLLRPIFQEDEWKLILLGGVLGVAVGLGQVYALGS